MRIILIAVFVLIIISGKSLCAQESGTFTDSRDGHVYKIVRIGNQRWMAENLAFKSDQGAWFVDDDEKNLKHYGYFYKWETALSICPEGWKLPSKSDFETLIKFLGGNEIAYQKILEQGSSGFSAALAGWRGSYGGYSNRGNYAFYWSSTKNWNHYRWGFGVFSDEKITTVFDDYDSRGFSVRCLKED